MGNTSGSANIERFIAETRQIDGTHGRDIGNGIIVFWCGLRGSRFPHTSRKVHLLEEETVYHWFEGLLKVVG